MLICIQSRVSLIAWEINVVIVSPVCWGSKKVSKLSEFRDRRGLKRCPRTVGCERLRARTDAVAESHSSLGIDVDL
jgi:hypothetical protein